MKASKLFPCYLPLFLFAGFYWISPEAKADPAPQNPDRGAVVLMTGGSEEHCGTAFFLDSKNFVTNAHVARALCPSGSCELKLIETSAGRPEQTLRSSATVKKISFALDLAILELKGQSWPGPGVQIGPSPRIGDTAEVVGYPACGTQQSTTGKITELDSFHLSADAKSLPGNSGSPILNSASELIGILSRSDTFAEGIAARLFGKPHPSRGIPIGVFDTWRKLEGRAAIQYEIDVLLQYQREELPKIQGSRRAMEGLAFISGVEGVRDDLLRSPETPAVVLRMIALLQSYPDRFNDLLAKDLTDPLSLAVEELLFAASLEGLGAAKNPLAEFGPEEFIAGVKDLGRPQQHLDRLEAIYKQAAHQRYPGMYIYFLSFWPWAFLFANYLGSLIWGMGWVFGKYRATFIKRVLVMILVGIFWPISAIWILSIKPRTV